MVDIEVTPATFENVFFDAERIREIAARLVEQAGLADHPSVGPVRIEVDESTPLPRVRTTSLEPLVIEVESGAFDDRKRTRQLGEVETADALGRQIIAAADRLDPAFGAPPLGEDLPLPHAVAWDTYVCGRLARSGYAPQRQRRLYNFELRHGFTDVAIAAFERLWSEDGLTFAEIAALSDETRAVVDAA